MHESMQVDPMSINYQLPFASRLLILYLFAAVVVWVVSSVSVLRTIWSFRRIRVGASPSGDEFLNQCRVCSTKIESMKRLAFVTLLWTVLVAAIQLRSTFVWVVRVKAFWTAALGGGVVETLDVFIPGILVAAVLYSASILYAGSLQRTKDSWNRTYRNAQQTV